MNFIKIGLGNFWRAYHKTIISVSCAVLIMLLWWGAGFIVQEPERPITNYPIQAGYFITIDNVQKSFYVTRLQEPDENTSGARAVCFIHERLLPMGEFYEECVPINDIYDFILNDQARVTKESVYVY